LVGGDGKLGKNDVIDIDFAFDLNPA